MRDVRINKDVPVSPTYKMNQSNELLDFRNKKIPPIIIKCVQVHVCVQNKGFKLPYFSTYYETTIL